MADLNLDELERECEQWERARDYRPFAGFRVVRHLIARIRELTSYRDSWCNQAADRLKDWDDMRQRAEAAEKRIRELEQDAARYQHVRAHGMPKLCPAGFYYHDGVFYPTADAAIDAYMAAIDAARKEKGHG